MRTQSGFAVAVVLLVSAVALAAAVGSALFATVASREVATSERRATSALFAAESGMNTLVVRSKTPTYELLSSDTDIQSWLTRVGLDSYTLPDGSQILLSALNETADSVTIRAEGVSAGGSRRVVLQEFTLATGTVDLGLFANAALVTQGSLSSNSAVSTIIGRDSTLDSWRFEDRVLSDALIGEYFETTVSCTDGTTTNVTYRMADTDEDPASDDPIDVEEVWPGACTGDTTLAPGTLGTLIPFAVAAPADTNGNDIGSVLTQTFAVTDTTLYAAGSTIIVGVDDGVNVNDYTATINSVGSDSIEVTWDTLPASPVLEATPIRREVPSALAETSCPSGPKTEEKLPQGCYLQDLSNIWDQTFPDTTKGEMLQEAVDNSAHYGPEETEEWPSGNVSGVTWIDGAQTGNFNGRGGKKSEGDEKGLCGEGIVILNTGVYDQDSTSSAINLNVSDCEFSGILYVIGELGIQGNLDSFSGTIIVETDQGTRVQGNGTKALYDPIAIRKALANLDPPSPPVGFVGAVRASWRFGE